MLENVRRSRHHEHDQERIVVPIVRLRTMGAGNDLSFPRVLTYTTKRGKHMDFKIGITYLILYNSDAAKVKIGIQGQPLTETFKYSYLHEFTYILTIGRLKYDKTRI